MGRATETPPPTYDDDAAAGPVHTSYEHAETAGLLEQDDLVEPPSYTDAVPNSQEEMLPYVHRNMFAMPYEGNTKTRSDGSVTIWNAQYDTNPDELFRAVMNWSQVPPAKMVQIKGTHSQTTKTKDKSETKTVVDFDVKIRLTDYLFTHLEGSTWRDTKAVDLFASTFRGTVTKRRANAAEIEEGEASIYTWCERYVDDLAKLKK
jgi:hypothetical protein